MFHAGFGEIRFLKWCDVINSNSWFLTILKGFSFTAFKLTFFFFLKKDFNKNWYFICQMVTSDSQSARPIHPLVSIWCKLLEESICEWPLTNRTSFWPILKLSHALDGLFSVLSRLHGCKHKCTFCRMKHHWAWCDYFQILLLGILSSMEPTIYFQI